MLLHIRPRLFSPFKNVALIDLHIDPLGLSLTGGVELTTRRPYPNKNYAVACRKEGQKAIDGILVETPARVDAFSVTARWAIEAATVVNHRVDYTIRDRDFDTATDDSGFWFATSDGWSSRMFGKRGEPMMEVVTGTARGVAEQLYDEDGWIVYRLQSVELPTIERERLLTSFVRNRTPDLAAAFKADTVMAEPVRPKEVVSGRKLSVRLEDIPF